jgi:alanine racemase
MVEKFFKRTDLQAHLYSDSLRHNVKMLKGCCAPKVKFCAVVKSNAYGHGITNVVNILKDAGVDFFAVANIYEAFHIVDLVDKQKILILEPVYVSEAKDLLLRAAQLGIHWTIDSIESAKYVESALAGSWLKLNVHIYMDCGMSRGGVQPENAAKLAKFINDCKNITLAGIYTHFATADEKDLAFALNRLEVFMNTVEAMENLIGKNVLVHAANSSATMRIPQAHFDMVRCGIALYGYSTLPRPLPVELKPALKLCAPIVHITTIEKGKTVSYGRTFTAERETKIAVLAIGYSDGFRRRYSNKTELMLNGKKAPVVGRVTMNETILDITNIPDAQTGQMVTVIDNEIDSPCGVYTLAGKLETICYEILTSVPPWVNTIVE